MDFGIDLNLESAFNLLSYAHVLEIPLLKLQIEELVLSKLLTKENSIDIYKQAVLVTIPFVS